MENKEKRLFYRPVGDADNNRWLFAAGLDEMRSTGCYTVQLWHGNGVGELPLPPCDNEHYIVATLIVTESGTAEKLQKNRIIGQTLILSQCNDGQTGIYYRSLAPVNGDFVWSEWNALLSAGQFNEIADGSTSITMEVKDNSVTAQKLSADVRTKVESPLRPLYIAAGAEYNDSGVDKTKTSPWGETVTHKAGHYYLNGLGDITEEQMMDIYIVGRIEGTNLIGKFASTNIRTNLPTLFTFNGSEGYGNYSLAAFCNGARYLQVLTIINSSTIFVGSSFYCAFLNCQSLEYVYPSIDVKSCAISQLDAFRRCNNLKHIELNNIKADISLRDSALLFNESILYAIQNAHPNSAITITLHPDAYVRCANDADIVAALEAQPLVSLVSA